MTLLERQANSTWNVVGPFGAVNLNTGWERLAGGDAGLILRHDGLGWSAMATPAPNPVKAMSGAHGILGAETFAVGAGGFIWRCVDP